MHADSWDDDDKLEELTQHGGAGRFLIIRERHEEETKGKPVGFVNFRFTLQVSFTSLDFLSMA